MLEKFEDKFYVPQRLTDFVNCVLAFQETRTLCKKQDFKCPQTSEDIGF